MTKPILNLLFFATVALAPVLCAAETADEEAIVGNWFLDRDSLIELNESMLTKGFTKDEVATLLPIWKEAFGKMKIALNLADGGKATVSTTVVKAGQATVSKAEGTWSLDGGRITIRTEAESGDDAKTIVGATDGKHIILDLDFGSDVLKARFIRE